MDVSTLWKRILERGEKMVESEQNIPLISILVNFNMPSHQFFTETHQSNSKIQSAYTRIDISDSAAALK